MSRRRSRTRLYAAVSLTLAASAPPLLAVDYYFVGPSGSAFSDPANWSTFPNGPGGTPPTNASGVDFVTPSSPSTFTLLLDASPNGVTLGNVLFSGTGVTGGTLVVNAPASAGTISARSISVGPNVAFNQAGGDLRASGGAISFAGNATTYSLSGTGSLFASDVRFSDGVTATQSGGSVSAATNLYLGGGTQTLSYSLSGGTLGGDGVYLDGHGPVSLAQTGGSAGGFYEFVVARNASYSLAGGTLSTTDGPLYVGSNPHLAGTVATDVGSTLTQTGGTARLSLNGSTDALVVNANPSGAPALYSMSGGLLLSPNHATITVGDTARGTFVQTGGSVGSDGTATPYAPSAVVLGRSAGSSGSYSLTGGSLSATSLYVGPGGAALFAQTGGTATFTSGIHIGGGTDTARYAIGPTGPNSPPGYNPQLSAGSITLDGPSPSYFVQNDGSSSVDYILVGRNASFSFGAYAQTLSVYGSILVGGAPSGAPASYPADSGATFTQYGGYALWAGASSLPSGADAITVNANPGSSARFNLSGGNLYFPNHANLTVGSTTTGTFAQTGGAVGPYWFIEGHSIPNYPATVTLGKSAGATGTYSLSGTGTLLTQSLVVGDAGTGSFVQTGGSVSTTSLSVNPTSSYSLAGTGALTVSNSPFAMTGAFTQSGGQLDAHNTNLSGTYTHSAGHASLWTLDVDGGTYNMTAAPATLTTTVTRLGQNAPGTFNQAGGRVAAIDLLQIGGHAAAAYTLSDGSLAPDATVLDSDVSATFVQTGGSHGTYANVVVGRNASYSIAAGSLAAGFDLVVGSAGGTSTLTQSGGDVSAGSGFALRVGKDAGTSGTYNLSGGALSPYNATVGDAGSGYLRQTGGSNVIPGLLRIAAQAGSTGIYDLVGGSLTAPSVANNGTFYMQSPASFTGHSFTNNGSATFDGAQSWYPDSTFSNTLVAFFHSDPGSPTSAPLSITSASPDWAPVVFDAPTTHLASLALSSATHASVPAVAAAGTPRLLSTRSLTIADTAQLDLANNTLLIDYGTAPSPADTIRDYLLNAHLTSSMSDPTHRLGYLDTATVSGEPTAPPSLTVQLTLTGDANLDGQLNADDYALIDRGFATNGTYWWQGDFNYDGTINQNDYLLIDTTYGQAQGFSPGFLSQRESQFGPAYVSTLLASTPEPTSLLTTCGLALPLLTRRRRRTH